MSMVDVLHISLSFIVDLPMDSTHAFPSLKSALSVGISAFALVSTS